MSDYENLSKRELIAIIRRSIREESEEESEEEEPLAYLFRYYTDRGYYFIGRDFHEVEPDTWMIKAERERPPDHDFRAVVYSSVDQISGEPLVTAFMKAISELILDDS